MKWRWWRNHDDDHEVTEAGQHADEQLREAKAQGGRVDRAIRAHNQVQRQVDRLALDAQRAMRPRGT